MNLRPYQTDVIAAVKRDWETHTDVLAVMATGLGKTIVFLELLTDVLAGGARGLILAHRQELIDQPLERLEQYWPQWLWRTGVVMAERDDCDRPLTIASIQTLAQPRRLQRLLSFGPIDYVVVDESHHVNADTYLDVLRKLRAANPALRHLGVTATPMRGDGDGLARVYQTVSATVNIKEGVKGGYLVPPRWLAIQTGISIKGVGTRAGDFAPGQLAKVMDCDNAFDLIVATHKRYADGRKSMAFTVSVDGAYQLAERFNAAGIPAAAADGTTPKDERRQLLQDFRAGKYQVLANCGLWTEGLDVPEIACIHQARPTKSDGLYVQIVGRGLRPVPGKDDCLILDYLPVEHRNIAMLGDILGVPIPRKDLIKQQDEPGEVQAGFTFDGNGFKGMEGDPLEIIARQLDYLELSPFAWDRRDGWLVLGLGGGADLIERVLAISPPDDAARQCLIGLWRRGEQGEDERVRYGPWQSAVIHESDDFEALSERANDLAEKHGSTVLVAKERAWQRQPISDAQRQFLLRLAGKQELGTVEHLSKGDAAKMLTFLMARKTLQRSGLWR